MESTENLPIRKTAFMMFKHCEKQFEYFYSDKKAYTEYKQSSDIAPLRRGTIFHNACEDFFTKVRTLNNKTYENFRSCLPVITDKRDLLLNNWFDYYAQYEHNRGLEILNESLDFEHLFYPIETEMYVKMKDTIDRNGHIDAILNQPDGNLMIVEYKTGKSYNMEKTWAVTKMNAEIGYYVQILNKKKYFGDKKITHWKVINPTLREVWINRISPVSLRAVENTYAKMVDKILHKGQFVKNITPLCSYCQYMQPCFDEDYNA